MPGLLEGLATGLSNAAGSNVYPDTQKKREASAHEQLQAQTNETLDEVRRLHDEKAKLHPGTDDQAISAIDKRLGELQTHFTDLYHPEKNPGALQHLGGFLKSHLSKNKAQVPTTPAEAKAKFSGFAGYPAGITASQGQQDDFATANTLFKKATGRDMTPDEREQWAYKQSGLPQDKSPKPEAENWKTETITLPDGRSMTVQHNTKDGRWTDLTGKDIPAETLSAAMVAPKQGPKKYAWTKKGGKFFRVLLDDNGQIVPGSENPNVLPPSYLIPKISEGNYHWVDQNNQVHSTPENRTSRPDLGGTGGAGVPKTPGEARAKAAAAGPKGDKILGTKISAPVNKARTEYNEAVKLSSMADQVAQKPNDAINQKRLAVALERVSAGRFTTQALDYIIKAGWGNTLAQWANNPTTGALPPDIMRQLVDGAHENLQASKDALSAATGGSGSGDSDDEFLKKF